MCRLRLAARTACAVAALLAVTSRAQPADPPAAPAAPVAPAAPAAAPAEDLLAAPEEQDAGGEDLLKSVKTFGEALLLHKLEVNWSGYGDFTLKAAPGKPVTFSAAHFNPIMTARMGESLTAEIELEFEAGKFLAEYWVFDVSVNRALVVRLGRFLIPIGRFNEELHPSFRWTMVTRPAVVREALPAIWTDVGVQARGTVDLFKGSNLAYAAYVVNGLGGDASYWAGLATRREVLRDMRRDIDDVNSDKAVGGRLAWNVLQHRTVGAATLGASFYSGAVDPAAAWRASIAVLDLSVRAGPVTLRAEAVQSWLGVERVNPFEPFERGVFVALSLDLDRVNVSARWDWVSLRPGLSPAEDVTRKAVLSAAYFPSKLWSLRAEVSHALGTTTFAPELAGMAAFSF